MTNLGVDVFGILCSEAISGNNTGKVEKKNFFRRNASTTPRSNGAHMNKSNRIRLSSVEAPKLVNLFSFIIKKNII